MKIVPLDLTILEQLHLEEALLRADTDNWCLINRGTPPAIVMGISGKAHELVHLPTQLPIIQRYTGGGTVVVDHNTLFVSFICNQTSPYPEPLMRWSSQFFPHLTLHQNDFVIGDKKCGGNAQYIRKNRFVHHISFLWDYDETLMRTLKMPRRTPPYRRDRSHEQFLTRLKNHFYSIDEFLAPILDQFEVGNLPEDILLRPHRRATKQILEANGEIDVGTGKTDIKRVGSGD